MAEEFKELIEQLQTNNKEEAQRDSNLNKNIAHSRNVNQAGLSELLGRMVVQTEATKAPDKPDESDKPDEGDEGDEPKLSFMQKMVGAITGKTGGAAETEEQADKESGEKKTRNLLKKIAGGIGGIATSMKDAAVKGKKTIGGILKGTLLAGFALCITILEELIALEISSPLFKLTKL